ncbi:hypothetical protein, partial [Streptomyces sp. P17]|uniref:hypothetical protein n=1 Tax=Streptomyces sp. P17 TaxID=3074716 RepID=UPI0028F455BB
TSVASTEKESVATKTTSNSLKIIVDIPSWIKMKLYQQWLCVERRFNLINYRDRKMNVSRPIELDYKSIVFCPCSRFSAAWLRLSADDKIALFNTLFLAPENP